MSPTPDAGGGVGGACFPTSDGDCGAARPLLGEGDRLRDEDSFRLDPLREWIRRARTRAASPSPEADEYPALAVALALALVEHLIFRLANAAAAAAPADPSADHDDDDGVELMSLLGTTVRGHGELGSVHEESGSGERTDALSLRIEDIAPENVFVEVTFGLAVAGAYIVGREGKQPSFASEQEQLCEEDVCYALGKILFEVFSRGESLLQIKLGCGGEDNASIRRDSFKMMLLDVMGSAEVDNNRTDDMSGPAPKKSSRINNSGGDKYSATTSTRAKLFLQERGLPLPVCQLVSDLLDAKHGGVYASDTALASLEDARFDLSRMKALPERFLMDQRSPAAALENTRLFHQVADDELFGREAELGELMEVAARVAMHVPTPCDARSASSLDGSNRSWGYENQPMPMPMPSDPFSGSPTVYSHRQQQAQQQQQSWTAARDDFLVEAAFLSGHSGSGKTSVTKKLVGRCVADGWSCLTCKFDRQVAPLTTLLQSVDAFFRKFVVRPGSSQQLREPAVQEAFDRISRSLTFSLDFSSFGQLCILLPSLSALFPKASTYVHQKVNERGSSPFDELLSTISARGNDGSSNGADRSSLSSSSSPGAMGSGRNRLNFLLGIVFKALCSGGHPVLVCLEDMQWADASTLGMIGDFVEAVAYGAPSEAGKPLQGGLLYLGNFRDNEVEEDGVVANQIEAFEGSRGNVRVTKIDVGGLALRDVNEMLSYKLCLPMRHTRELAQLVYQKTRGNPLYIVEFLRSIIQSNALSFSVKERKWIYEELCIDMQLISEGVVELLAIKLKKLPTDVLTALKVMACFGSQIMTSVIELLDLEQFVPSMQAALELAVKEGIIEKAGPAFAFIHDTLQESTYNLIHATERNRLHKMIGMSLAHDPEVIKLAVDQINICKDSGILNPIEKAQFARLNLTAGKNAVRTSSYEQARGYFLAGISLLSARHWETQYELAIDLYEWSVSVCFMDGNVENSRIRLDAILTHARTFEDSLNARAMVAKLCVAQEKYAKGVKIILEVLEVLGEVFPSEVDAMLAKSEIEKTMPLLTTISRERILELPPLTDGSKLGAMKFLCLLIHFTNFYSPLFVHLISCRMIQITFAHGYCEDFISALVTYAHGMILYGNDIALMKRIKSTAENLIRGHPNEPSLTSRLTTMLATPKIMVEPCQAVVEHVSNAYKSARMVGDLDMANVLAVMLCVSTLCCVTDLSRVRSQAVNFLHEMERNKRMGPFRSVMTIFNACTTLIGDEADAKIETETNVELYRIAKETHNTYLMHHVILHQMHVHIIFRDHLMIIKLAEKYRTHAAKRVLDFFVDFYEGLAALVLARDTKQEEWISIGEKSVEAMTRLVSYSTWNFENKLLLLQAEIQYTKGRIPMAELSYQAAILSAHEHRFYQEEALAVEMFGICLIETGRLKKGLEQLRVAVEKYRQFGCMKKSQDIKDFIKLVTQTKGRWKT